MCIQLFIVQYTNESCISADIRTYLSPIPTATQNLLHTAKARYRSQAVTVHHWHCAPVYTHITEITFNTAYPHFCKFFLFIICLHIHDLPLSSIITARILLSIPPAICATFISLSFNSEKLPFGASGGNIPCALMNADMKISSSS